MLPDGLRGHSVMLQRAAVILMAALGSASAARAQGGPPLETDDPGTPGPGHLELNVSAEAEHEAGGTTYDAPRLDANLGVGTRLQLKLEVPWRIATAAAQPTTTGVGNVGVGLKYRFVDGPVSVSTYPQAALGRSESASDEGIADSETEILLPVQIAWDTGPVALNVEVGYQHSASSDEVEYGLALGHLARPSLELLGECHGSGDTDFTGQGVLCGVGFRWTVERAVSVLGAYAAAVAGAAEDRPDSRLFGGVQLRW
jgi:hypothetical protein